MNEVVKGKPIDPERLKTLDRAQMQVSTLRPRPHELEPETAKR